MLHSVIVFLHVASAMGIVAAFGVEAAMLAQLRGAYSPAAARAALGLSRAVQRVGASSMIVALVTGIYLATAYWRWRGAWMGFGFLTLIAIAIVGAAMTWRRVQPIARAVSATPPIDVPRLWRGLAMSFAVRTALLAGIVFLMTVKPATPVAAVLVVIIAAALGIAIGWLALPSARATPNDQLQGAT